MIIFVVFTLAKYIYALHVLMVHINRNAYVDIMKIIRRRCILIKQRDDVGKHQQRPLTFLWLLFLSPLIASRPFKLLFCFSYRHYRLLLTFHLIYTLWRILGISMQHTAYHMEREKGKLSLLLLNLINTILHSMTANLFSLKNPWFNLIAPVCVWVIKLSTINQ
jgi:hypothetical protein